MMRLHLISLFSFLAVVLYRFSVSAEKNATEFAQMLTKEMEKTRTYELPTNNSRLLRTVCSKLYDYGTFDFIVIGSGSAGAVVANRLSEITNWKILLLEAGGLENEFCKMSSFAGSMTLTDYNWGYYTTSQENACQGLKDSRCIYARGLVSGGTSAISAAMYSTGNKQDYDGWAAMGNHGWSSDDVLPYYKKLENAVFEDRERAYHGEGGYVNIELSAETPGIRPLLSSAFEEIGLPTIPDCNIKNQIGLCRGQYTMKGYQRISTATAYLEPFKDRKNFNISLNSFVTKILIRNFILKTAYGVEFVKDGKRYVAKAKKEVILSAGVMNSPQLLMLSGIGPKEHLKELGFKVIKNLPVGKHLLDHVSILDLRYRTKEVFYNFTFEEQVELYLQNKKPLTTPVELYAFINLNKSIEEKPDIMLEISIPMFDSSALFGGSGDGNPLTDIAMNIVLLNTKSEGSVRLKSKSPEDMPLIDSNLLSDPKDMDLLYRAIQYVMELNQTKAIRTKGAVFRYSKTPSCDAQHEELSKAWWICYIKFRCSEDMHGVGTARMGPSPKTSVVNSRLKVHGIRKLRVVDASVIPAIPSGNTNAPAMMIGEKAADLIKKDYGKL